MQRDGPVLRRGVFDDEDRAGGSPNDPFRHAPHEQVRQSRAAVRAGDDQITVLCFGRGNDLGGGVPLAEKEADRDPGVGRDLLAEEALEPVDVPLGLELGRHLAEGGLLRAEGVGDVEQQEGRVILAGQVGRDLERPGRVGGKVRGAEDQAWLEHGAFSAGSPVTASCTGRAVKFPYTFIITGG